MDNATLIPILFFRTGYVLAAIVLTACYWLAGRNLLVRRMIGRANTFLAFFAICMALTGAYYLFTDTLPSGKSFQFLTEYTIPPLLIVGLWLGCKKYPIWILPPLCLLANFTLVIYGAKMLFGVTPDPVFDDTVPDQVIRALGSGKPYVLVLMGIVYLVLVFLSVLLTAWFRSVSNSGTPPK